MQLGMMHRIPRLSSNKARRRGECSYKQGAFCQDFAICFEYIGLKYREFSAIGYAFM